MIKSSIAAVVLLLVVLTTSIAAELSKVPAGSKIYVAPGDGFDTFLAAALTNKKVPVIVVADKDKADFILEGTSQTEKAGWARTIFMKQTGSNEEVSIRLVNVKTSEVVFAYAVNKHNSVHGKQSSAEACAKHLKEVVGKP